MNINLKENNSEKALLLSEKDFTQEELLSILSGDNILEKQIALIKINILNNKKEAEILLSNLTGQDTRIRENTAYKIHDLFQSKYNAHFQHDEFINIFVNGVLDVNPSVCRAIIDSIQYIENKQLFFDILLNKIDLIMENLPKYGNKTHDISKKLFNLYWALEALSELKEIYQNNFEKIKKLLLNTYDFSEYTIREKVAKILNITNFNDDELKNLKQKLINDENFYVRNCFTN